MNLSGPVIRFFLDSHLQGNELDHERVVVITVDNRDLPVGKIKIKSRGKSMTHKGMASVMRAMGDLPFHRLWIGTKCTATARESSVAASVISRLPTSRIELSCRESLKSLHSYDLWSTNKQFP